MLNPSTADASVDDPTIRRCLGFAHDLGFGQLEVVNLFALRATDPKKLGLHHDPIGGDNDYQIIQSARICKLTICAWGTNGTLKARNKAVLSLLREGGITPHALRFSKQGHPAHPLYLPKGLQPIPFL